MSNKQRLEHLRTLEMQGLWAGWTAAMSRDLSWRRMFAGAISDAVLKFVVNSTNLSLPSEDNKRRWGFASAGSKCFLVNPQTGEACGTTHPTVLHVLSGCKAALEQGRYTWRHNSLLLVFKQHLIAHIGAINSGRLKLSSSKPLRFVSADGRLYNNGSSAPSLAPTQLVDYLARAHDWELRFDLPGDRFSYNVFPPEIATTSERPDILLLSKSEKMIVCIELTSPSEERLHAAHTLKASKYEHLTPDALINGWRLTTWPIEVGCRGCVAFSVSKMLRALRLPPTQQLIIKQQLEDVAIRCSYYIFCSRTTPSWDDRPMLVPGGPPRI